MKTASVCAPGPPPEVQVIVEGWYPFGWRITLLGLRVGHIVERLKALIPAKQRTYNGASWLIAKRGERHLIEFLSWVEQREGCELVDRRLQGAA